MRGTHIRKLQQTHGIPVAVPVQRRNGKPGDHDFEGHAEVRRPDGSMEPVKLHLCEGHPYLKTLDNTGTPLLVPLEHEKTARSQRDDGTWRLYGNYLVPDQNGGGTVRLRLDQTAEDCARTDGSRKAKPFNREEYLRAFRGRARHGRPCTTGVPRLSHTIGSWTTRSSGSGLPASAGSARPGT